MPEFADYAPPKPSTGTVPTSGNADPPRSGEMSGTMGTRNSKRATPVDYFRPPDSAQDPILPQEPVPTLTPERIQFSIRLRFNPIRNLKPELLAGYLDSFRLGFFRQAALSWDAMERRDTRLQTVAPKRKKSVARHGYEILAVDDTPMAALQKGFLETFYNNISVTTALEPDEQGGFSLLLRQMMDAVGKRYAVHEIVWQPRPDGNLTAKFIFCPLWWFEGTRGKLRYLLNEFQIYGIEMDPCGWLITVGDGIMEACSVAYIFKHLPLRDWLNYSERFGMPGILGKTDAAINSQEWEAFGDAVESFSADWSAICNRANEIDLIEVKNAGEQPFERLVNLMDEEMTRLWRGNDLGTASKTGSVGASLQADESDILEVDDAMLLTETLTLKVSRLALAWKFGPEAPQLAYIKIKTEERDKTALDLQIDQFLLSAGFPISQTSAAERYAREIPGADDELLIAPAAPASAKSSGAASPSETELANESHPGPSLPYEQAAAENHEQA
jgi:phage gp29-like protein